MKSTRDNIAYLVRSAPTDGFFEEVFEPLHVCSRRTVDINSTWHRVEVKHVLHDLVGQRVCRLEFGLCDPSMNWLS